MMFPFLTESNFFILSLFVVYTEFYGVSMPLLLADFIRQSLQTILRITLDTTRFFLRGQLNDIAQFETYFILNAFQ